MGRTKIIPLVLVAATASLLIGPTALATPSAGHAPAAAAAVTGRPATDPVVITGSALGSMRYPAGDAVAFRWDGFSWHQVPVQVDERAVVDAAQIYGGRFGGVQGTPLLVYTDASTFTGADPDPLIDGNDEVVLRSGDVGSVPQHFTEPAGVVGRSGVQVTVTDPLTSSPLGQVFVFRRSTGLDPSAGVHDVTYRFALASGAYKATYELNDGPNPENSLITTASYRHHFSDRWLSDQINVTTSGASGVDILDRQKALFAPDVCGRSEDTFDDAEGAFVANKVGPIRAIRSYVGANSGPLTERTHLFYASREDVVTDLRVHTIPGVMDFFDYSPAAIGMRYSNNRNTNSVLIDGVPDQVSMGSLDWEKVDGPQGVLVMSHSQKATVPVQGTSWYEDNATNPSTQCTGDADAIGASGPRIAGTIDCTDPSQGCTGTFQSTRRLLFGSPGVSSEAAAEQARLARTPLTTSVIPYRDPQATDRFVVAAYHDFLHRAPDPGGEAYWTGRLDQRLVSQYGFVVQLAASPEWVSGVVTGLYQDALGRPPDETGRSYWVDQIRSGRSTVAQVAAAFYASDEYYRAAGGGTLQTWVTDLYRKLLGREPDAPGRTYWVNRARAEGRGPVAFAFFHSPESARARVAELYQQLLQRDPDGPGQSYWAGRIVTDGDLALAAQLAASPEYFANAQDRTFG